MMKNQYALRNFNTMKQESHINEKIQDLNLSSGDSYLISRDSKLRKSDYNYLLHFDYAFPSQETLINELLYKFLYSDGSSSSYTNLSSQRCLTYEESKQSGTKNSSVEITSILKKTRKREATLKENLKSQMNPIVPNYKDLFGNISDLDIPFSCSNNEIFYGYGRYYKKSETSVINGKFDQSIQYIDAAQNFKNNSCVERNQGNPRVKSANTLEMVYQELEQYYRLKDVAISETLLVITTYTNAVPKTREFVNVCTQTRRIRKDAKPANPTGLKQQQFITSNVCHAQTSGIKINIAHKKPKGNTNERKGKNRALFAQEREQLECKCMLNDKSVLCNFDQDPIEQKDSSVICVCIQHKKTPKDKYCACDKDKKLGKQKRPMNGTFDQNKDNAIQKSAMIKICTCDQTKKPSKPKSSMKCEEDRAKKLAKPKPLMNCGRGEKPAKPNDSMNCEGDRARKLATCGQDEKPAKPITPKNCRCGGDKNLAKPNGPMNCKCGGGEKPGKQKNIIKKKHRGVQISKEIQQDLKQEKNVRKTADDRLNCCCCKLPGLGKCTQTQTQNIVVAGRNRRSQTEGSKQINGFKETATQTRHEKSTQVDHKVSRRKTAAMGSLKLLDLSQVRKDKSTEMDQDENSVNSNPMQVSLREIAVGSECRRKRRKAKHDHKNNIKRKRYSSVKVTEVTNSDEATDKNVQSGLVQVHRVPDFNENNSGALKVRFKEDKFSRIRTILKQIFNFHTAHPNKASSQRPEKHFEENMAQVGTTKKFKNKGNLCTQLQSYSSKNIQMPSLCCQSIQTSFKKRQNTRSTTTKKAKLIKSKEMDKASKELCAEIEKLKKDVMNIEEKIISGTSPAESGTIFNSETEQELSSNDKFKNRKLSGLIRALRNISIKHIFRSWKRNERKIKSEHKNTNPTSKRTRVKPRTKLAKPYIIRNLSRKSIDTIFKKPNYIQDSVISVRRGASIGE